MDKSLFEEPRPVSDLESCLFYHSIDLPGHGLQKGFWDIRGKEDQYLGNFNFSNKRVLELGPASGHLSFFMEREGAEVVAVEASNERVWELYWRVHNPLPPELDDLLASGQKSLKEIKNSYWFSHRAFRSKAKVHYGNAYDLPAELGRFDVAVMACMLLHNKSPLLILENCARVTSEAIIIVEPIRKLHFSQSSLEFVPNGKELSWDTWWGFTPKFFVDVLRSLGFKYPTVTRHSQICFDKPQDMFTIVARREPFPEPAKQGKPGVELSTPVERLRLAPNAHLNLPVTIRNIGDQVLSSFTENPLLLSYHWKTESGEVSEWNGLRTSLPYPLEKNDSEELLMSVKAPDKPGKYVLELTLVREDVEWLDETIPGLPFKINTSVA